LAQVRQLDAPLDRVERQDACDAAAPVEDGDGVVATARHRAPDGAEVGLRGDEAAEERQEIADRDLPQIFRRHAAQIADRDRRERLASDETTTSATEREAANAPSASPARTCTEIGWPAGSIASPAVWPTSGPSSDSPRSSDVAPP